VEMYQDLPNLHKLTLVAALPWENEVRLILYTWTSIPLQLVETVFYSGFPTELVWRYRPFIYPRGEGKGLRALAPTTCAGTKIVTPQSDCSIVN